MSDKFKIFANGNCDDLEKDINKFARNVTKIINIQYSTAITSYVENSQFQAPREIFLYSVLIEYIE